VARRGGAALGPLERLGAERQARELSGLQVDADVGALTAGAVEVAEQDENEQAERYGDATMVHLGPRVLETKVDAQIRAGKPERQRWQLLGDDDGASRGLIECLVA